MQAIMLEADLAADQLPSTVTTLWLPHLVPASAYSGELFAEHASLSHQHCI